MNKLAALALTTLLPAPAPAQFVQAPPRSGGAAVPAAKYPVRNLGLDADSYPSTRADGALLAFVVREAAQQQDLNGDGDLHDVVLHVYDHRTGETTNIGEAVRDFVVCDPYVAFLVHEEGLDWKDLNGDPDRDDYVAHVYDARTGAVINTGLASLPLTNGTPLHQINLSLAGDLLLVPVFESWQGGIDLNGNGTTYDTVPHVVAIGGATVNLGVGMRTPSAGQSAPGDGRFFAFSASEWSEGDLNGDGDVTDVVLHVYDALSTATTNVGLALGFSAGIGSKNLRTLCANGRVAFGAHEAGQVDLNGDGDLLDAPLLVYDAATAQTTSLGDLLNGGGSAFGFDGRLVGYGLSEKGEGGVDLNGDGDTQDTVVHVHDTVSGVTTNTGRTLSNAGYELEVLLERGRATFLTWELYEGVDLNGDGDLLDQVAHVFEAATAATTSTGLATSLPDPSVRGRIVSVPVHEGAQGGVDLNGDGDVVDQVPQIVLAGGGIANVGRSAHETSPPYGEEDVRFVRTHGPHVVFGTSEYSEGMQDLNGDGDALDVVLHVYHAGAGTLWNSQLALDEPSFAVGRGFVAVSLFEYAMGVDLNGDGDTWDQVVHVVDLR